MTFDLLLSADLSVDDADRVAALLVAKLGLPQPAASWVHDWPETEYKAYFLRTNPRRIGAPTAIEIIGPHPATGFSPHLGATHRRQGDRPVKTHSTVFSVPDVLAVSARLTAKQVPHWLRLDEDQPNSFPRIWVGQSGDEPEFYDASFDAGLVVEYVPTGVLGLRPDALEPVVDTSIAAGAPVRVASRSFVVDRLDAAVEVLDRVLDLRPEAVFESDADACRVAEYRGTIAAGASLRLLEPTGAGIAHDFLDKWGAGAFTIAIAVNGLAAAAAGLTERGVSFVRVAGGGREADRLRVDPAELDGAVFEFVEA
ncbi:MAG: hypothetical protein AB7L13_11570 [Acidimicrobiia bacterium]